MWSRAAGIPIRLAHALITAPRVSPKKTGSESIHILGQLQCAVKWTYSLVFCLVLCPSPLLMYMRIGLSVRNHCC